MRPQHKLIYEYIQRFGSITPLEAMRDLGVMALSQRIGEMKRLGFPIAETEMVEVPNRYKKTTRVARYRLEGRDPLPATAPKGGATGKAEDGGSLTTARWFGR